MRNFFKENLSTLLILVLLALLLIPQTGTPIKVFVNRLIAFSPSEIEPLEREVIKDYHWRLTRLNGASVNFQESEGKVTLVNFWATWCPPCIAEMPSMQSLFETYGDEMNFYFVSLEAPETLQKFLKKKEYKIPVYIPQEALPEALETNSFPTTYLISKNGAIVIKKVGAADWNSEKTKAIIKKLLAE